MIQPTAPAPKDQRSTLPREPSSAPVFRRRIPFWVKLLYTAFVAVLVPFYWRNYGPANFLYLCDAALFMTLAALWSEKSIWASMAATGILLPQAAWILDFLLGFAGRHPTGMTDYMFDPAVPLFARLLSLFHFWLPLLLLWILRRLGYDRRALILWSATAWGLLLASYFLPPLSLNINCVRGINGSTLWLHPLLYLITLMTGLPLLVFLPTHLALKRAFQSSPVTA